MAVPAPQNAPQADILVRSLGRMEYTPVWQAMQEFTLTRQADTPDEIWLVEHPSVFTLGLNGKPEHVLDAGDIPLIQTDRGGQVTYHGPGQLVAYLLFNLKRHGLGVRPLVSLIEQAIIDLLAEHGIPSVARQDAPGVYVNDAKVAALGLRIKQGCSYHGLSLNIDMDLSPFQRINPCGYQGLKVTRLVDLGITTGMEPVSRMLLDKLSSRLNCPMVHVDTKLECPEHE